MIQTIRTLAARVTALVVGPSVYFKFRRTLSHHCKKMFKRHESRTNNDPVAAVTIESVILRIQHSTFHANPRLVSTALRIINGVAVSQRSCASGINSQTSAGFTVTLPKIVVDKCSNRSAITSANRRWHFRAWEDLMRTFSNTKKSCETSSDKRYFSRHIIGLSMLCKWRRWLMSNVAAIFSNRVCFANQL